jgi:uncharacterized SAM-binding protein YcdF (DUF218 family)
MNTAEELAQKIWNYMLMHQPLEKADVIIGLGTHDSTIANWTAELYLKGYAPCVLFTGDGRNPSENRLEREAELFTKIAQEMGVPKDKIFVEPNAKNTGENILFSKELLKERGIKAQKILVVQKPFMERRAYASFRKQWPDVEVIMTSPNISFKDYTLPPLSRKEIIGSMVGDCERMTRYAELGFQIPQEVPADVIEAAKKLREMGYNRRTLNS